MISSDELLTPSARDASLARERNRRRDATVAAPPRVDHRLANGHRAPVATSRQLDAFDFGDAAALRQRLDRGWMLNGLGALEPLVHLEGLAEEPRGLCANVMNFDADRSLEPDHSLVGSLHTRPRIALGEAFDLLLKPVHLGLVRGLRQCRWGHSHHQNHGGGQAG